MTSSNREGPTGLEVKILEKEASSSEKKRSLFWIVLIVLVLLMGALGWQAKSLLNAPGPTQKPVAVRAKVPPAPVPTTIPITPPPNAETATPNMGGVASEDKGNEPQPASTSDQTEMHTDASDTAPESPIAKDPDLKGAKAPVIDKNGSEPAIQPDTNAPAPNNKGAADMESVPALASSPTSTASKQKPDTAMNRDPVEPKTTSSEPVPLATPLAPYTIQVGAFRVKTYADDIMAQLSKGGYAPYIFETADANQKPWYAVRIGHYETRSQATQALLEFKQKEKMDAIISRSDAL